MSYMDPQIGEFLQVTVERNHPRCGLFVRTPNGYEGLVKISDIAWNYPTNIAKSLSRGDMFEAKVIGLHDDGKIDFSRKEALPNPEEIELGTIMDGIVDAVADPGVFVRFESFVALAPWGELSSTYYKTGDYIKCVLTKVLRDDRNTIKAFVSTLPFHSFFASRHSIGERIMCVYVDKIQNGSFFSAIVCLDGLFLYTITHNNLDDDTKDKIRSGSITPGDILEAEYTSFDDIKGKVVLDMTPIQRERRLERIRDLRNNLSEGDIVFAEVKQVGRKEAQIQIEGTNVTLPISREELSPNKVIKASDEVFVGERIQIAFVGENEDGSLQFSRRFFVKDMYDDKFYDMTLDELLGTMDIHTTQFIGKAITINDSYFFTELMTVTDEYSAEDGKLLVDPINGKNVIAILDNRLRNLVEEGEYYKVSIDLAKKDYRKNEGSPYMFHITRTPIIHCENPYKEAVTRSFSLHRSPESNVGLANLLNEVGQGLYSSKKRMFFELLQNADDAAPQNGVKVKIQIDGQFFVLTHDGYSFNKQDFNSISSAAKSTKSSNKKKTGYKGIGFKSVFTNSDSVYIKSGGFSFSFDRNLDIYNNFEDFYFRVNKIEGDRQRQEEFLRDFAPQRAAFNGVKDIPWHLLPCWSEGPIIDSPNSIFKEKENVAIALRMDGETLSEYEAAVDEVFNEPHFMLFLMSTNRIQLIKGKACLTIKKNISDNGKYISLVNSFKEDHRSENFKVFVTDNLEVSDDAFVAAGVLIRKRERTNKRDEVENYFVRIDASGAELSEVPGIPDRITSTTSTTISFAMPLDEDDHLRTIDKNELSLFAYLPMNEHRFRFPFFVNADFIPKSDREGVQSDNPWNYFLFYNIGKAIVSMVIDEAEVGEKEYLNLLPAKEMESTGQDTAMLVDAFNRGYREGLINSKYILSDQSDDASRILLSADETIIDDSKLTDFISHEDFYKLIGTAKHLPHTSIDTKCLSNSLFGIEIFTVSKAISLIEQNLDNIQSWVSRASEKQRNKFFEWFISNEKLLPLITKIPSFKYGDEWVSFNSVLATNNRIITTEKFAPIVDILSKLGFACSDNNLSNHPLKSKLPVQGEKGIFSKIESSDLSNLNFTERLSLFNCAKTLESIGDETVEKWPIFKNALGTLTPLNNLFAYNEDCPDWLKDYMIIQEESHSELIRHMVSEDNIYLKIVEPNIESILEKTNVLAVYERFSHSWRQSFTVKLIESGTKDIISIVERSDDTVKLAYINSLYLSLNSKLTYSKDSIEYRILKLAASNPQSTVDIRSRIRIDEVDLEKVTVKDRLTLVSEEREFTFKLEGIIPNYTAPVNMSSVFEQFQSIDNIEQIFAAEETTPEDAMRQIVSFFQANTRVAYNISAQLYCFLMLYRKYKGYTTIGSGIGRQIIISADCLHNVFDFCFENKIGHILNVFLRDPYVQYPIEKTVGRYFDADDYTLESERAPEIITGWATSAKKKDFLIELGFHDGESQEIQRRKSFKENKYENIWNLTDKTIINGFLDWVKESFELPIVGENQVKILKELFDEAHHHEYHYEDDLSEATEWTNEQYLNWKKTKDYCIYIVEGNLPVRGDYQGVSLYKRREGEYTFFEESRKLYITSTKGPEVVLSEVCAKGSIPFTKDDWNSLFLVSTTVIQEKDEEIAKLRTELEKARNGIDKGEATEVKEHGNLIEIDNTDESTRQDINREARIAAKEFLDSLEDYDASAWDPEKGMQIVRDIIKYKEKPIVVAILSSRQRKLYLHPRLFAELMEDPDNLLLNYGYDNKIHSLSFDNIFRDNPNVNLIFDTDCVSADEIAELANKYMYSKRTCFVVENLSYSQDEVIKSFGLNEKKQDGSVRVDLSEEEIFDFGED